MPLCINCGKERLPEEFISTKSPFHPNNHSSICIPCLEELVPYYDLEAVDAMCRWLDIPFLMDQWTRIDAGKRTLRQYVKILKKEATYDALDWSTINEKWKAAQQEGTLEDQIPALTDHWRYQMRQKWPAEMERTDEDYRYLEDFYKDLCATQNLVTATQRDDAKRLAEVGLLINKKIRAGLDAKNEMAKKILAM